MGRYYSGDIEGKFWFAVQDSNDGEFFGAVEDKGSIQYYIGSDELEHAKAQVQVCMDRLGKYKALLDVFFEEHNGYNDEMIMAEFAIDKEKVAELLVWYARLELGEKIVKCVEENGYCSFTAEL